ncbi:hypothetical protein [Methanobrevibacter sp.]
MSLRYKFHHLFFGGKINKKRLYQVLEDLDSSNDSSSDTETLESSISSLEDEITALDDRIKALEDAS